MHLILSGAGGAAVSGGRRRRSLPQPPQAHPSTGPGEAGNGKPPLGRRLGPRLRLEALVNRSGEEQVGDSYVYRRTKSGEVVRDYQPNWRSQSAVIYVLDAQRIRKVDPRAGQELAMELFN